MPERYEIQSLIGQGGMASVYKAVERDTGRVVAIKRLHEHLQADAAMRLRFQREVQIARALEHPNIARIYEVIAEPPSLVMEYGGGRDLKELIRERAPMPPEDIEPIARQVLSALAAAHRAGIIHRDVKPQNILIDDQGRIKLVDFGLARLQGMASLTTKSMIIGTPDYIAPELLTDHRPDPRSDLYSLGVVLYEMATGALPFSGNAPLQIICKRPVNYPYLKWGRWHGF
jgi:serine/threonine protein kinase